MFRLSRTLSAPAASLSLCLSLCLNIISFSATAAPIVIDNATENMRARLEINGAKYQQLIEIDIKSSTQSEKFKKTILDGEIMRQVSQWVKNAQFIPTSNSQDSFSHTLAIGRMGLIFTHRFNCHDLVYAKNTWHMACEQAAPAKSDRIVIQNAANEIACEKSENPNHNTCVWSVSGSASDIKTLGIEVQGTKIIGTLFREYVNYIGHLGFILNGEATSIQDARAKFKNSAYEKLLSTIDHHISKKID